MSDPIQAIIGKMTLEEKAALCTGASMWTTTPIERLGVPELIVSDGPHGLRHVADVNSIAQESLLATCFPTASCTASTWDVDLLHQMGEALAEECIAQNVDVILGPGANMKRSPLCGRNFEYFSEDPYLTAFEKAVKQARPWTVMCSYNKLNGTLASENRHLLTEILKDEWGFEGLIVSDWGAVRDRVAALKGGVDLEMPGPREWRVKAVVEAVRSGEVTQAELDEAVRRILRIVFKAKETPKNGAFDADAHHELARKLAAEGMVLLKNNGLLPLKEQQHIAVIGRSAESAHFQGGGSSHINTTRVDVPFKMLQERAGDAELTYAAGYPADDSRRQDLIDEAVTLAGAADVAVLYIALPTFKESEGYDRVDLDLTAQQAALIQAVSAVQPNTVVVLNNGAPVAMDAWIDGVAAVLEGWMMGQAGGAAIADVLFGRVNPSGKLAETFPNKLSDTPAYINWPGEAGAVRYGEGLFIGYRYYDAKQIPVLFPFGYGLSYTRFAYSNARVSQKSFKDVDGVTVSVDVTNTGAVAGKEIVQLYVHDQKSKLVRPEKELKGFAKVELQPGETKTVSIKLDFRAFAFYHPDYHQWISEDGDFDLLVAASSADIRQTLTVTLTSTLDLPCILDVDSTIREWLDDPRGKVAFAPLFAQIEAIGRQAFGGSETASGESPMGLDFMAMFADMPLIGILGFLQGALPRPGDEMVKELLAQVHGAAK